MNGDMARGTTHHFPARWNGAVGAWCIRVRYDCVYVGAGCVAARTMDYLKGLLNVGGVMVAPFDDELLRVEASACVPSPRGAMPFCRQPVIMHCRYTVEAYSRLRTARASTTQVYRVGSVQNL